MRHSWYALATAAHLQVLQKYSHVWLRYPSPRMHVQQMKIILQQCTRYAHGEAIRNAPQQLIMLGRCVMLTSLDCVQVGLWGEVDRGFGRTGVQSFALEGVLGELQVTFQSVARLEHCKQTSHIPICIHQQWSSAVVRQHGTVLHQQQRFCSKSAQILLKLSMAKLACVTQSHCCICNNSTRLRNK